MHRKQQPTVMVVIRYQMIYLQLHLCLFFSCHWPTFVSSLLQSPYLYSAYSIENLVLVCPIHRDNRTCVRHCLLRTKQRKKNLIIFNKWFPCWNWPPQRKKNIAIEKKSQSRYQKKKIKLDWWSGYFKIYFMFTHHNVTTFIIINLTLCNRNWKSTFFCWYYA